LGVKSTTLLLRSYLKLYSPAMTLFGQMPALIFSHDDHTVRIPWSVLRACLFY